MLKIIISTAALLLSVASFSQGEAPKRPMKEKGGDPKLTKGNALYNAKAYANSIETYEKAVKKGYKSIELYEKLGDAYFFNSEYVQANKWYADLFQLGGNIAPIYYYRYSQTLKSAGETKKAQEYLEQFSKLDNTDSRAMEYAGNKNYLAEIEDNSGRYKMEDLGVNSNLSDYGASIYNDRLVFTSSRLPENGNKKKDNWTSDYFSSLYSTSLSKEGDLSNVQFFAEEIRTQYHESSPTFTKDGNTMFFTRSSDKVGKSTFGKSVLLKIYKASLVDGKWGKVTELPFNNNQYSCAHPVLSPDEKTLYFVSDMPGSYGDSDIYRVAIIASDSYGTPINLGKNINTQGKETFPWVNDNNELYFASDGHLGLGGLDVFVSNIEGDNFTSKVVNVGEPINSGFDDFGFLQLRDSKIGFLTSNREDGKGKDDIYRFTELDITGKFEGQVLGDGEPLANATIGIYDSKHYLVASAKTDDNGNYEAVINRKSKDENYYAKAEAPGFETKEVPAQINKKEIISVAKTVSVAEIKKAIKLGDNLVTEFGLKGILFNSNKADIRNDAKVELNKVVQLLKDYPQIKIAINAYTDSSGAAKKNMVLSDRRAKSTKNYLIANGISKNRITAKGYGETKLLNNCNDGVRCSDAEHQKNRRVDFIVVKM